MSDTMFGRPITVFVGLGFPRQLDSAEEALHLLSDVPEERRDASYISAVRACRAAIDGKIEPDTARGIIERYARQRGMLADEAVANLALAAKRDVLGM